MPDLLSRCLGGVVPPIATPLSDDGALDVPSLTQLARHLISSGVSGLFALGSTGEAAYLIDQDRHTVIEALADVMREAALPLLVGIAEPTARRVLSAAAALPAGASAFVVTGPFYAQASHAEIRRHFELIASGTALPLLAYNIPVNVGYELPVPVLAQLLKSGVIAGVKDSSPNLSRIRELSMAPGIPENALLFSGSDSLLDCALAVGANGSVAGLSNVVPQLFVSALRAYREGDGEAVAAAQTQIHALTDLYTATDSNIGLNSTQLGSIKTALQLQGIIASDAVSPPMTRSGSDRVEYVKAVLARTGLLTRVGHP